MIRASRLIWVVVLAFAIPSFGQDYSGSEVFVGYSGLSDFSVMNKMIPGWQGSYAFNVSENLGIVADVGGHYTSERTHYHTGTITDNGLEVMSRSHEFLFGPRFNARGQTVTGFVHYLAGVASSKFELTDLDDSSNNFERSGTNFAQAVGGGIDLQATDSLKVRAVQVDLVTTRLPEETIDEGGGVIGHDPAIWQTEFRLAFGIVFGF